MGLISSVAAGFVAVSARNDIWVAPTAQQSDSRTGANE